ncbi:hypothetical protein HGM15179_018761 [Zosterops borbonicus]|uniref:Integrase n=1 Tax=Zosterops borbonicus TaxID=364589 RepID=A0A8K1DAJ4_9PASS|nr:hypothetical protein HGM15179_018761 [Zosterops borbonicus]
MIFPWCQQNGLAACGQSGAQLGSIRSQAELAWTASRGWNLVVAEFQPSSKANPAWSALQQSRALPSLAPPGHLGRVVERGLAHTQGGMGMEGEDKPKKECKLTMGGETVSIEAVYDTETNLTIVPKKDWPSHWPSQSVGGHVQGEKSWDAIIHLVQAFSFMGIPKALKTDNGPAYKSKEFRNFLQQWGVEHKTDIPHSPTGQAVVERTHQDLKRVLSQQHQVLKTESPSIRLAKTLFTMNFLNCSFEMLNPPIVRHFGKSQQLTLKEKPPVLIKEPETGQTEGPHKLVMLG